MSEDKKKKYTETLSLPKTEFEMRGNLPTKEPAIIAMWEGKDIYNRVMQKNANNVKFVFHDGPPYANGDIHIGHAFNKTLKDIVVRYKNMCGYYAPFIPGWDTHGMPIEKKVEQVLKIDKEKVGIAGFRAECEKYALTQVDKQTQGFKRMGVFADFENRYVTMDHDFEARQIELFGKMYNKGYIYRDLKPVYWCADCATALAEAEIEYQDSTATSIYVKFHLLDDNGIISSLGIDVEKVSFVIWTTTPWTIPGNQAVTVNPEFEYSFVKVKDEFLVIATDLVNDVMKQANIEEFQTVDTLHGKDLENIRLQHPLLDKVSRVILGSDTDLLVSDDTGTGLVHTAPGHGHEDYLVCKRYKDIEITVPVDEKGYMTQQAGCDLQGLKYTQANDKVLELLSTRGYLLTSKQITHPYPYCWRCHKPVIYRATTQWFCSVDKFRQEALDAVKTVNWYPDWGMERMVNMIKDRTDWCISRQRVWGVPIPIFYCADCKKEYINSETIEKVAKLFKEKGSSAWYELTPEEILKEEHICECGCNKLKKETDIMDVWFDSGSSHAGVLTDDKYKLGWPADLYLEGNDQYRGWFQSSLLTSVAVNKKAPFRDVVTHGFLTDGEGKKMSKSLGNGIDPFDIFNEFGADILRLWSISADYHTDVKVSKQIIAGVADIYKKIRNTARFILGSLNDFNPDNEYVEYSNRDGIDKYIMYKLNELIKVCLHGYDTYDFHSVFESIHSFCTDDLSSKYLDAVKDRLYTLNAGDVLRKSTQSSMYDIILAITKLLAPVIPFTAEEIYKYIPLTENMMYARDSVMLSPQVKINEIYEDKAVVSKWENIYMIRDNVLLALEKARADKIIGHSLDACVVIAVDKEEYEKYLAIREDLEFVTIVSKIEIKEGHPEVLVVKHRGEKCDRCWKYCDEFVADEDGLHLCTKCQIATSK